MAKVISVLAGSGMVLAKQRGMKCRMRSVSLRKIFSIARIFLVSVLLFLTGFARLEAAVALPASPCTLAWSQSQDVSIAGYALYYGITGSTTNRQDLGMVNTVTLFNLLAASNYYFYLTSYNAAGVESSPSGVLYYKPQALSSLKALRPVFCITNRRR